MNILPLIISFILIFATVGAQFLRETRAIALLDSTLASSFKVTRDLHNTHKRRQYTKAAALPKKTPKKTKKQKYYSLREISPATAYAKLNLMPLLQSELAHPTQHPLYPIAATLLRTLYQDSPIAPKQSGWEYLLLDSMLQAGKQSSHPSMLSDLFPSDPSLQALYYSMLKGTRHYQICPSKGIPCLTDFFSVEKTEGSQSIHFNFASPTLLTSLLGQKLAAEVLAAEKAHWEQQKQRLFFSKEKLDELLLTNPALQIQLSSVLPYLGFNQQLPEKEALLGRDTKTQLCLTRPV